MISSLCLVLLSQGPALERAELRLRGPLERPRWEDPLGGALELELTLRQGEERRLVAPFARRPSAFEPAPTFSSGEIEIVAWIEPAAPGPAALYARARPAVEAAALTPSPAAGSTALLAAVVVLALRRRPLLALAVGLTLAAGAFWLQHRAPLDGPSTVRVLEGLQPQNAWQQVDAAAGRLGFEASTNAALALELWPAEGGVRWSVTPRDGRADLWTARAPGRRLVRVARLDPGTRAFEPALNRWGALEATWLREADGSWGAHGAWPLGEALPPGRAAGAGPPGWLASRLPQGRRVLIGRLAPGAFRGETLEEGQAQGPSWIRLVGFPAPE